MAINHLNEEEIRSNLIIPLLKDIGISCNRLKLETSFSIQLGRGVYDIKNDQKKFIGGRLDILCKADHKNLFIIELKAENEQIDETKDRKQGLSYARLLDPMPPYVIVTNGCTTYLYDTITGKEVDRDFIKSNGFRLAIDSEINLRLEALKNFVGYSYQNLEIFCKTFNNEYLNNFRSSKDDTIEQQLGKKYIPSIYVKRGLVTDLFKDFLSQDKLCTFPIIGASGVGKTNTIINLFEEFSECPSVFYSGTLLGRSFFEELKFDFNLEFSPNETELSLLKKISSLAKDQRKPFVIFIDALDEWIAKDKTNQLDNLTKVLIRYGIKLCVSCKDIGWNSFLVQRGIPTLFSRYLFVVPLLTNFNDAEFSQALKKYTRNFKLKVNVKNLSNELHNPFSLRISCEVSRIKNIALDLSQNSRETISTFIYKKLSKTGKLPKLKRYLISISQILLVQSTFQIEENQIRKELMFGINEELPIELFSSNILYRNISVESQDIFIGFYFSKIRDHIISMEVLALCNRATEDRIVAIRDCLHTFVGENAVNYFFRTGTKSEQDDCIAALIKFDRAKSESKLTKILVQQEDSIIANISPDSIKGILGHITFLISNIKNDGIISREIGAILGIISLSHDIEYFLIDLLVTLNDKKENAYDISPEISRILQNYDTPEATEKIKNILLNKQIDNRIRRFVIDIFDSRELEDRISVFNSLLDEAINGDGENIFFYARHWYKYIENTTLRNKLLKLFDNATNNHVQDLLVRTLAYSDLKDTGKLLFFRFQNATYSEHITCWLCRAICSQNYLPAIPKLIELLKKDPTSALSDHILIGLGEMQAKETMPALLEIIIDLDEKVDTWWLSRSFSDIAEAADYEKLNELYSKTANSHNKFFIALTLAKTKIRKYNKVLISAIKDNDLSINQRSHIISEWSNSLTTTKYDGYSKIDIIRESEAKGKLNIEELNIMYDIFGENTELSIHALAMLINFEQSIPKLANSVKEILPNLNYKFITRKFFLVNIDNLERLSQELNPWLHKILMKLQWENSTFLFNCIQFAGVLGDEKVLESIRFNRNVIIELHEYGESYIKYIEHTIRAARAKIRLRIEE